MKILRPDYVDIEPENWDGIAPGFDRVELKLDGQLGFATTNPDDPESGTVVVGEYLIGSNWAIEHDRVGEFVAFDLLCIRGQDLAEWSLRERREILLAELDYLSGLDNLSIWSRHGKMKRSGGPLDKLLTVAASYPVKDAASIWKKYVIDQGYEGLVFKSTHEDYFSGWARMKREFTKDYVILGFNESKAVSKRGVMVQSIIGGLFDGESIVPVCNVGGISNELSADMYSNPEKYIGQIFEAKGKGLFKKTGALRHPAFVRLRDDKVGAECTF